jgi:hypothetical protein
MRLPSKGDIGIFGELQNISEHCMLFDYDGGWEFWTGDKCIIDLLIKFRDVSEYDYDDEWQIKHWVIKADIMLGGTDNDLDETWDIIMADRDNRALAGNIETATIGGTNISVGITDSMVAPENRQEGIDTIKKTLSDPDFFAKTYGNATNELIPQLYKDFGNHFVQQVNDLHVAINAKNERIDKLESIERNRVGNRIKRLFGIKDEA